MHANAALMEQFTAMKAQLDTLVSAGNGKQSDAKGGKKVPGNAGRSGGKKRGREVEPDECEFYCRHHKDNNSHITQFCFMTDEANRKKKPSELTLLSRRAAKSSY